MLLSKEKALVGDTMDKSQLRQSGQITKSDIPQIFKWFLVTQSMDHSIVKEMSTSWYGGRSIVVCLTNDVEMMLCQTGILDLGFGLAKQNHFFWWFISHIGSYWSLLILSVSY